MLTPEQVQSIRQRVGIQPPKSDIASEFQSAWAQPAQTPSKPEGFSLSKRMAELPGAVGGAVKAVGEALTSSERGLGHTIGETAAANIGGVEQNTANVQAENAMKMKVQDQIAKDKLLGKDTSHLEWALQRANQSPDVTQRNSEQTPSIDKTTGQVAGELGGTALDTLSFGTYGKAADAMKSGSLALKTPTAVGMAEQLLPKAKTPMEIMKSAGKASLVGGGVGYGYDVAGNLQNGDQGGKAFMPGLGTLAGLTIPIVAGTLSAGKQIVKPSPEAALRDYKGDLESVLGGKESGRKMLTKAEKQGKSPVDFLTHKAALGDQVPIDVVDGVYKTQAGQDKLWSDVNHLDDMLTEGLKSSPERVSLVDLEKQAVQSVMSNPEIRAAGNSVEASRKVKKIFANLKASYGDVVPLNVANEIKSGQWKEAKSLFSKMQPNYAGNTNFQIGQVFKGAIEKKMGDAPVKALNEVIGQHLTAAEALAKLDNSVAKNGKIGKYFFRTIGAIAGSHAGPVGTILGAGSGELAGRVAQQIPVGNPFRAAVLGKLGKDTPAVVKQFAEYLSREEAAKASRLKLTEKSGAPMVTPHTGYEPAAQKSFNQDKLPFDSSGKPNQEKLLLEAPLGSPTNPRLMPGESPQINAPTNTSDNINIDNTIPEKLNYGNVIPKTKEAVTDFAKNPKAGLSMQDVTKSPDFYDKVATELTNYDTSIPTVNGKPHLGNTDADFRLMQLQEKLNKTALSKVEIQEAYELLKDRGVISPESMQVARNDATIAKNNKVLNDPLVQEARKYKSAEEFVKAQGDTLYHGTGIKFDEFDPSMRGSITGAKSAEGAIWFTDNPRVAKAYSVHAAETGVVTKALKEADALEKIAKKSGKESDWKAHDEALAKAEKLDTYEANFERRKYADVKEATLKGDFYEVDAKGKTPQDLSSEGDIDSWLNEQITKAKKLGKDGVKITNLDDAVGLYDEPATHWAIFDTKNIKTKSQLTDIYNQAHNK